MAIENNIVDSEVKNYEQEAITYGKFFDYYIVIFDPRQEGKIQHKLLNVLFIAVVAIMCRCDEWKEHIIKNVHRRIWHY